MIMRKKAFRFHYAWLILLACCALQAGSQGTIFDTLGVFNSPVCSDLNFDLGSFTMGQTFSAIAMMITQPLTTGLYRKFGIKKVLLVSGILYYLSYFSLSFGSEIWHWYLLLAIEGITGGFFYRTSYTILLCKWFASKTALALGVATAVGSIMGMIMNPLASVIIGEFGWRTCYMVLASVGSLVTLPIIALVVKESPSELNMKPYYVDGEYKNTIPKFDGRFKGKKANLISILIIIKIKWI